MTAVSTASAPALPRPLEQRGTGATALRRDRAHAAAGLRVAGKSVWQIADTLGVHPDDVDQLVAEGLATYASEDPEARQALRNLAAARLEKLLDSVWEMGTDPEDPQFIDANTRAQSLVAELNRLLGLNAPAEHKVHSPELAQIGQLLRDITGLHAVEADPLDPSTYVEAEIVEDPPEPDETAEDLI